MPATEITFDQPVTDPPAVSDPSAEAPVITTEPAEAPAQAPAEVVEPGKVEGEADPQPESQETEVDKSERDDQGRFKKGRPVQARIDELTRGKHEAEREAAYWKGLAGQKGEAPSAPADAPTKPTPESYSDYGQYVEALTEWAANQTVAAALSKREAQDKQSKEETEKATRVQTWETRQEAFRKANPRYDEVMATADMRVANHVMDALLRNEQGPAIAMHLAVNPDEVQRINSLDKDDALIALGEIKSALSKPVVPVVKSVTKAPAPITPVGSGRSSAPDLNKMSQADYEAARKSQGAWWAR